MYIHHVILLLQNETRPPCWGLFCDNNQQGVLYLLHIDLAVSTRTVILVHPYSLVSFNQIWLICLYLGWSFVFCVRDRIKLELSKLRNSILYKLNMIWNVSSYVTNRVLFFYHDSQEALGREQFLNSVVEIVSLSVISGSTIHFKQTLEMHNCLKKINKSHSSSKLQSYGL